MLRSIDHIVVVVRDLAETVDDYRRAGFSVTPGGEHVGGATHNALVSFANGTYFELIAFREPDRPQPHRWWPRLSQGEGLVDYALLSDDLNADAKRVRASGLDLTGPVDGGRRRPDGQELIWKSIMLGRGAGGSALPFVIQDITPRDLRVPGGPATAHPLGVTRVAGLTVVVGDLAQSAMDLGKLLGSDGQTVATGTGNATRFDLGQQWVQLLQPSGGPAAEYLQRHGDSAYEVVLSRGGAAEPASGALLQGSLHGARIRVAG